MNVKRATTLAILAAMVMSLSACGSDDPATTAPVTAAEPATDSKTAPNPAYDGTVSKPGAPFSMSYRIIGTPVVGSPLTIELQIESLRAPREIAVDYRINDASSMMLHEAQPARVLLEPAANESVAVQRITIVPQREGRMYLNVSASIDSEDGSESSIMAIPIQVGVGTRQIEEQGEVTVDEEGEAIRVLTND
jgi:hypothetical protein